MEIVYGAMIAVFLVGVYFVINPPGWDRPPLKSNKHGWEPPPK